MAPEVIQYTIDPTLTYNDMTGVGSASADHSNLEDDI
jgi:hypothetical protein